MKLKPEAANPTVTRALTQKVATLMMASEGRRLKDGGGSASPAASA